MDYIYTVNNFEGQSIVHMYDTRYTDNFIIKI